MSKSATSRYSPNEMNIQELIKENVVWRDLLFDAAEEIQFLNKLLIADVFEGNQLNLFEKLQKFSKDLDYIKSENMDLTLEVHKHRYDLEGMMECEDINCDVFYQTEHVKLGLRIEEYLTNFREYKLGVFRYTGDLLNSSAES